jgi:SAP domain-containing protein
MVKEHTREELEELTVKELREILSELELKKSGKKSELVARISFALILDKEELPVEDLPGFPFAPELPELVAEIQTKKPGEDVQEAAGSIFEIVKAFVPPKSKLPKLEVDPSKNRKIPVVEELPTLARIMASCRRENDPSRRGQTLSAGSLGLECKRQIYYRWRWAQVPDFSDQLLRIFERGNLEEPRMIESLRKIGISVWSTRAEVAGAPWTVREYGFAENVAIDPSRPLEVRAPSPTYHVFDPFGVVVSSHGVDRTAAENVARMWNDKQIKVTALSGHIGGRLDGIGKGFDEAPKAAHVLEFKTSNAKTFKKIKENGVELEKPEHYGQIQFYMRKMKIERTFYFVTNKDNEEIYGERVSLDRKKADAMIEKAREIISSSVPPDRLRNDPTFWKCKFCDFSDQCHRARAPETNCRTCIHSTPVLDPTDEEREFPVWICEFGGGEHKIDGLRQSTGCPKHLMIPDLLGPEFTFDGSDSSTSPRWISYYDRNGSKVYNVVDGEEAALEVELGTPAVYTSSELSQFEEAPIATDTDHATLRRKLSEVPF